MQNVIDVSDDIIADPLFGQVSFDKLNGVANVVQSH
jgi:hypothetical protein